MKETALVYIEQPIDGLIFAIDFESNFSFLNLCLVISRLLYQH
jgi:hypothetical protein